MHREEQMTGTVVFSTASGLPVVLTARRSASSHRVRWIANLRTICIIGYQEDDAENEDLTTIIRAADSELVERERGHDGTATYTDGTSSEDFSRHPVPLLRARTRSQGLKPGRRAYEYP